MLCCRYSKIGSVQYFFLEFFFFFFFFLPFFAHESSIHDERLDGTTGSKIMRCVHMAKHSQKKISNMVKRAVFRNVPEPLHTAPLNFVLAMNQTEEKVSGGPVLLLSLTARVISE